jgi:hypothetical protein
METRRAVGPLLLLLMLVLTPSIPLAAQDPAVGINFTTWQQDDPAICPQGCVYRTGQNLKESSLTAATLSPYTFGQLCNYAVDGQIYGQPLVVENVDFNGGAAITVAYVVTQNGSVYAFGGTPSAPTGSTVPPCTLLAGPVTLLGSGETAVNCDNIGAGNCGTIAPNVGILGTPVIKLTSTNPATGKLYAVAESQLVSGAPPSTTYYHRLWALDITTLSLSTAFKSAPIAPTGSCSYPKPFSQFHIQRPALLLAGDNYLYVAFSMMDGGGSPLPNGMIFAYNTASLSTTPLCLEMSQGAFGADGAGIWQGGAGPAYGPDSSGTTYYTYFNTANGVFSPTTNPPQYGDSFIQMYNDPSGLGPSTPALEVNAYFAPADQLNRSDTTMCGGNGDVDYGSGGVMLIPEIDITWPFLAVSGDKEGGIWFVDRTTPGSGGGDGTCAGGANANVQTYPINGTGTSVNGPVVHTSPAYWKGGTPVASYLFMSSQYNPNNAGSGELMRYQLCTQGKPIRNSTSPACSTAGVYAYAIAGTPLQFPYGITPTISASGSSAADALVWAIWADGTDVPSTVAFNYNGQNFKVAQNGRLYAFDAVNMNSLYASGQCKPGGVSVDLINPATKFSVPTVANGFVYLGTQGTPCDDHINFPGDGTASCYNSGTFYIFGSLSRSCQ